MPAWYGIFIVSGVRINISLGRWGHIGREVVFPSPPSLLGYMLTFLLDTPCPVISMEHLKPALGFNTNKHSSS